MEEVKKVITSLECQATSTLSNYQPRPVTEIESYHVIHYNMEREGSKEKQEMTKTCYLLSLKEGIALSNAHSITDMTLHPFETYSGYFLPFLFLPYSSIRNVSWARSPLQVIFSCEMDTRLELHVFPAYRNEAYKVTDQMEFVYAMDCIYNVYQNRAITKTLCPERRESIPMKENLKHLVSTTQSTQPSVCDYLGRSPCPNDSPKNQNPRYLWSSSNHISATGRMLSRPCSWIHGRLSYGSVFDGKKKRVQCCFCSMDLEDKLTKFSQEAENNIQEIERLQDEPTTGCLDIPKMELGKRKQLESCYKNNYVAIFGCLHHIACIECAVSWSKNCSGFFSSSSDPEPWKLDTVKLEMEDNKKIACSLRNDASCPFESCKCKQIESKYIKLTPSMDTLDPIIRFQLVQSKLEDSNKSLNPSFESSNSSCSQLFLSSSGPSTSELKKTDCEDYWYDPMAEKYAALRSSYNENSILSSKSLKKCYYLWPRDPQSTEDIHLRTLMEREERLESLLLQHYAGDSSLDFDVYWRNRLIKTNPDYQQALLKFVGLVNNTGVVQGVMEGGEKALSTIKEVSRSVKETYDDVNCWYEENEEAINFALTVGNDLALCTVQKLINLYGMCKDLWKWHRARKEMMAGLNPSLAKKQPVLIIPITPGSPKTQWLPLEALDAETLTAMIQRPLEEEKEVGKEYFRLAEVKNEGIELSFEGVMKVMSEKVEEMLNGLKGLWEGDVRQKIEAKLQEEWRKVVDGETFEEWKKALEKKDWEGLLKEISGLEELLTVEQLKIWLKSLREGVDATLGRVDDVLDIQRV